MRHELARTPRLRAALIASRSACAESLRCIGSAIGEQYDQSVLVQLLYFPGCPHVAVARERLAQAVDVSNLAIEIVEIDVTDPATPEHLRIWGSPTILVDGIDVALGVPSGLSCRIYPDAEHLGAPSIAQIEAALLGATRIGSHT